MYEINTTPLDAVKGTEAPDTSVNSDVNEVITDVATESTETKESPEKAEPLNQVTNEEEKESVLETSPDIYSEISNKLGIEIKNDDDLQNLKNLLPKKEEETQEVEVINEFIALGKGTIDDYVSMNKIETMTFDEKVESVKVEYKNKLIAEGVDEDEIDYVLEEKFTSPDTKLAKEEYEDFINHNFNKINKDKIGIVKQVKENIENKKLAEKNIKEYSNAIDTFVTDAVKSKKIGDLTVTNELSADETSELKNTLVSLVSKPTNENFLDHIHAKTQVALLKSEIKKLSSIDVEKIKEEARNEGIKIGLARNLGEHKEESVPNIVKVPVVSICPTTGKTINSTPIS